MPVITVIARAKAKKGMADKLQQAMAAVVLPTHAEEGCIKYSLQRSVDDPELFVMIEKWGSKESLDKHLASAHVAELFVKLPSILAGPAEIQIFRSLSVGLPAKADI